MLVTIVDESPLAATHAKLVNSFPPPVTTILYLAIDRPTDPSDGSNESLTQFVGSTAEAVSAQTPAQPAINCSIRFEVRFIKETLLSGALAVNTVKHSKSWRTTEKHPFSMSSVKTILSLYA